ncbi:conserved membrane hypothetical protein [Vibrio nigripulchritudo MADA3029]|uniref:hypothetical protein n=1 Tax=Vibrio nigripulchritudo TaxID=28173 RepID=UPI0003B239D8|nr:hypothetical protein [Vibrio nigripulchritudo]CCN46598.1 conserved membrane hypothetical protein [Vibrio nigripulchritudo MADA3020]CCN54625.1 conserved membrane hypothetical protein [Vibrio nigripulchritudo MADA3021]CCN59457.1 conserved membrane hypothetical protein [Vibrio nigripulchritudo MADA3029]
MKTSMLLKISAVLWVIWGLVHILAGVTVMGNETPAAVQAVADGVSTGLLDATYPDAAGAIINQHGWNLAWFGVVTVVGAVFIWRNNATAIFVSALVGGMADLGYFIFLDLGGYVNFVPGTIMTVVSALAIVLSFTAYFKKESEPR